MFLWELARDVNIQAYPNVKCFWNKLEQFICDHCNNIHNFKFNEKSILFGTDDNFQSDNVLDFMMLYAKYFIYSCRYEKNQTYKI